MFTSRGRSTPTPDDAQQKMELFQSATESKVNATTNYAADGQRNGKQQFYQECKEPFVHLDIIYH